MSLIRKFVLDLTYEIILTSPSVLAPGEFDRSSLEPSAPAAQRLSFPSASPVAILPFTSVAFEGDSMTYTSTPRLLQTIAAVATSRLNANAASSSPPVATYTGSAISLITSATMVLAMAVAITTLLI